MRALHAVGDTVAIDLSFEGAWRSWEYRHRFSQVALTSATAAVAPERIEPVRQDLPGRLADTLTLDAITNLIRLTRNEVGHPPRQQIDEDTVRVHLTIAPVYLRKMQQLTVRFPGPPAGAAA